MGTFCFSSTVLSPIAIRAFGGKVECPLQLSFIESDSEGTRSQVQEKLLRPAGFRMRHRTVFHHSRVVPLPDHSEHHAVANPLLEKRGQMGVNERVEKLADVAASRRDTVSPPSRTLSENKLPPHSNLLTLGPNPLQDRCIPRKVESPKNVSSRQEPECAPLPSTARESEQATLSLIQVPT